MKSYIFLFLTTSWTIVLSEEINGLDTIVFEKLKNIHNVRGSKQDEFISTIWPELTKFLPDSARIPGVELSFEISTEEKLKEKKLTPPQGIEKSDPWFQNHICAIETKIHPKLAEKDSTKEITKKNNKQIDKQKGKIVMEVTAKFSMDGETMEFDVYEKLGGSYDAIGPIHVSYKFPEKSKISLVFDMPDISKENPISESKCLITLRSLEVTELSKPQFVNALDIKSKEIVQYYWRIFAEEKNDMKEVMSIGIRRVISQKLGTKDHWICVSNELKEQLLADEEAFVYKVPYQKYCKDVKLED